MIRLKRYECYSNDCGQLQQTGNSEANRVDVVSFFTA